MDNAVKASKTLEIVTKHEANRLMLGDLTDGLFRIGLESVGTVGLTAGGVGMQVSANYRGDIVEFAAFVVASFLAYRVVMDTRNIYQTVEQYLSEPAQYMLENHDKKLME